MKLWAVLLVLFVGLLFLPSTAAAAPANQRVLVSATTTPVYGVVTIESVPSGAEVVIDGRPWGTTPFTTRTLVVGTHSLVLTMAGYQDYSATFVIERDQINKKTYTLAKVPLALRTTTLPVTTLAVQPVIPVLATPTEEPLARVSLSPVATLVTTSPDTSILARKFVVPVRDGTKYRNISVVLPSEKTVVKGPFSAPDAVKDDDGDGIMNMNDECQSTPGGVFVYENGCRCQDTGTDPYVYGVASDEKYAVGDSCLGTTSVKEFICNPAYETGDATWPFLGVYTDCTWGCESGHCNRPNICSSYNPAHPEQSATCSDGIQNQGETGVDCGGKCPPCNTRCTTGTIYAPDDTPCTSADPTDMHKIQYTWLEPDSDLNYDCRWYEVCHPGLDHVIQEATRCCSSTTTAQIDTMPEPLLCREAVHSANENCQRCVGVYIVKGLGKYARWMKGYNELEDLAKAAGNPNVYVQMDTGLPMYTYKNPRPTAEKLVNKYQTGVCRDYALAVSTLLRKAGYPQRDVGSYCDGGHCYNVVKFPGDSQYTVVDTTGNFNDVSLSGSLPSGYPYCSALNENNVCFETDGLASYTTGTISDVDAYWNVMDNGGTWNYPVKKCDTIPGVTQWHFLPQSGPGVAVGRDNVRIPDFAPSISQITGC